MLNVCLLTVLTTKMTMCRKDWKYFIPSIAGMYTSLCMKTDFKCQDSDRRCRHVTTVELRGFKDPRGLTCKHVYQWKEPHQSQRLVHSQLVYTRTQSGRRSFHVAAPVV